ncbi:MAG: hypothetical protein ACTSQE_11040 [Candidatus Heimdallarchaeaceae archaeon]
MGVNLAGFGNAIPFGWLDIVHIYNLNNKESRDLSVFFTSISKAKGWKGIQTPYIPYFRSKPLKKANFIFFPKKLSLDMLLLKDVPVPEKVESIYFDWR